MLRDLLFSIVAQIADPNLKPLPNDGAGQDQLDNIINFIFALAGALAFLFIVIGGLRFILSRGNPEGVAKAKNTIIYALVGLLITVTSYGIITFVLNQV